MATLIDRFNAVLAAIAGSPNLGHVRYVDVRPALSNEFPKKYKGDWANELHPTRGGFEAVGKLFDSALGKLPSE